MNICIIFQDVNDNNPSFAVQYNSSVKENANPGNKKTLSRFSSLNTYEYSIVKKVYPLYNTIFLFPSSTVPLYEFTI